MQNIPDAAELFWSRGDEEKSIKVFCRIVIPNFFVELMTERFHAVMAEWLSDVQNVADRICEIFPYCEIFYANFLYPTFFKMTNTKFFWTVPAAPDCRLSSPRRKTISTLDSRSPHFSNN